MLSTSVTVVDGFPRALERTWVNLKPGHTDDHGVPSAGRPYWIALAALAVLTVAVLALFAGNLTTMVDFATIVSFLTAPVLGYLNLRAVGALPPSGAGASPQHSDAGAFLDRARAAGRYCLRLSDLPNLVMAP